MTNQLSFVIPAYNEEKSIVAVLEQLKNTLDNLKIEYEIIVVNDCSTDNTKSLLKKINYIKLINHPYNKGYGASLKTGVKNAHYNWVLFYDADGQHKPEYVEKFLKYTSTYDLIIGDRTTSKYVRPTIRKPGLWLLKKIANYLVNYKIPDLNCGMRLIKKDVLKKYLRLMPNNFSFSTTSTMAFLKDKRNVKFVGIETDKRNNESKSSVKSKDAITTLMLMFRLIMLFSPLKIFLPVSILLFILTLTSVTLDIFIREPNITDTTIVLFVSTLLIFFFGLLADQIAAIRREIKQ